MEKARAALFSQDDERGQATHVVPIHKGVTAYQDVMRALEQTTRVRSLSRMNEYCKQAK